LSGIVHVTASGTVGAWWFGASAYLEQGSARFAYAQLKDEEKGSGESGENNVITTTTEEPVADLNIGNDGKFVGGAAARREALSKGKGGGGGGNTMTAGGAGGMKANEFDKQMEASMKKRSILDTSVRER
jgi:hypothetical protein